MTQVQKLKKANVTYKATYSAVQRNRTRYNLNKFNKAKTRVARLLREFNSTRPIGKRIGSWEIDSL